MNKHVIRLLPACSVLLLLAACEKETEQVNPGNESEVAVVARTGQEQESAQSSSRTANSTSGAVITDAKVSVSEFELEAIDLSVDLDILSELEIELKEPRVLTLMAGGQAQTAVIAEGKLQHGRYTEAEFSYEKNLSVSSEDEMYGKSILIRGEFEGKPFVCWTDEESEVEIKLDEEIDVKEEGEIYVTFYLNRLVSGINFSLAVDGNADGVIEIGPGGADGNSTLYAALSAKLDAMAELD